jgi:hypothetical protein
MAGASEVNIEAVIRLLSGTFPLRLRRAIAQPRETLAISAIERSLQAGILELKMVGGGA